MLMLGESILSLLIVAGSKGLPYFITFYTGILSVTLFQYMYFRSQPVDIDDHAMRRSAFAGFSFTVMIIVFSGALIVFGGSYKLILVQYLDEQALAKNSQAESQRAYSLQQRQVRIANLFSWSLAFSFASLGAMTTSHRGFSANLARCRLPNGKWDPLSVAVGVVHVCLFVVAATLSRWTTQLEVLSALGLLVVVCQTMVMTLKLKLFPISKTSHGGR